LGNSLGAESDMELEGKLSFGGEEVSWKIPGNPPIITLNTKTGLAQDGNG
jgi:hypothetical protein